MTIPLDIENCDQCPFAKIGKVYTADSWEDVRKITCTKLNKVVYGGLDWNEKSTIPKECPFKENK